MDTLVQRLDAKLCEWNLDIAEEVRRRIAEIIAAADQNALDLMRSRAIEQGVVNILDEPATR